MCWSDTFFIKPPYLWWTKLFKRWLCISNQSYPVSLNYSNFKTQWQEALPDHVTWPAKEITWPTQTDSPVLQIARVSDLFTTFLSLSDISCVSSSSHTTAHHDWCRSCRSSPCGRDPSRRDNTRWRRGRRGCSRGRWIITHPSCLLMPWIGQLETLTFDRELRRFRIGVDFC